jgi:hypothetical protein
VGASLAAPFSERSMRPTGCPGGCANGDPSGSGGGSGGSGGSGDSGGSGGGRGGSGGGDGATARRAHSPVLAAGQSVLISMSLSAFISRRACVSLCE